MAAIDPELSTLSKIRSINLSLIESLKVFKGDWHLGVPAQRQVSSPNGITKNVKCMCSGTQPNTCNQSDSIMPLPFISRERFDWKPWPISCAAGGDTYVYDIQSRFEGVLQSGEWTNITLASTLTVLNVFLQLLSCLNCTHITHTHTHFEDQTPDAAKGGVHYPFLG